MAKQMKKILVILSAMLASACACPSGGRLAEAVAGFERVQDSARTKVWWFHGETETTREGITADLEAFRQAGVGGVVYYDQSHGRAERALPAFSPEWWSMLRFSAEEAQRLGLSFEVNISNGFVAGGPWITGELGMKRLTATERIVEGGQYVVDTLPAPRNALGYFKDVAVLAFPVGQDEATKIITTGGAIAAPERGSVYISLACPDGFTARSITYEVKPQGKATTSATNVPGAPSETFVGTGYRVLPDLGQLEVSDDGVRYAKVCNLKPIYRAHESWKQKTIAFGAVSGKYFRLNLHGWWDAQMKDRTMHLGPVALHAAAKIDQWEEKAGLFSEYIEQDKTPAYAPEEVVNVRQLVNLTNRMDSAGILRWHAPQGRWRILRFAAVPTGSKTKHGRSNLIGLECDRLSANAITTHWNCYVARILDSLRASRSGHVAGVVMDSHEAGAQNWTDDFIAQFVRRQGYDPTPFLPAMMGYVVNGVRESNDFLFDIRRNIADMMADNFYGTADSLCRQRGLVLTAQAIGNALCIDGDPIMAKSRVAKPQGEFWGIHPDGNYDIKESSSSAHLYGKPIASAEAFTDIKYSASPADIKSLADYAYAFGINELVVCASAYQPWLDKIPGSTGGGRHYALNRNNTWWPYSRPFWDYQARTTCVMRQGKPVADLCIYLGENAPVKILTYRLPDIPGGFDFDAFTSHALLTRMGVANGRIALPDGVAYKMMVLPRNGDITLDALRKIADLAERGATIFGRKPTMSGSKRDFGREAEYRRIADRLWGERPDSAGVHVCGKGRVYWGMPLANAMAQAGIAPDVAMAHGDTKQARIYFAHRRLADANIYFVHNHKDSVEDNLFTFASQGRRAQLWDAVSGRRYALPIAQADSSSVSVRLRLHPRESFLVVLTDRDEPLPAASQLMDDGRAEPIAGSWRAYFDERWGGPGHVVLDSLRDWTASADPRIRYYSGTAVYRKRIRLAADSGRVVLNLHRPGFVAQVRVNGHDAGTAWCEPWRVDITPYVRRGDNELEIRVANSLMNRMIYDASLPDTARITYAYPAIAKPDEALVPSGLTNVELRIKN